LQTAEKMKADLDGFSQWLHSPCRDFSQLEKTGHYPPTIGANRCREREHLTPLRSRPLLTCSRDWFKLIKFDG
jgi:hypothetical protein